MDLLSDNPLANMRGPDFLALYAIFACIAVAPFVVLAALDHGADGGPLPQIPARPDPYELAYLRDGAGGVVWLAIYALKRAGLVEITNRGRLQRLAGVAMPNNRYEAAVLSAIGSGCAPSAIIRDRAPGGSAASLLRSLESTLAARGLMRGPECRTRTTRLALWTGGGLVALAAYKAIVATAHGHRNIGGLILECMAFLVILAMAASFFVRRRANNLGRAYLDRVKLAHERRGPKAPPRLQPTQ